MDILERMKKYADKVPDSAKERYTLYFDELSVLCHTAQAGRGAGFEMLCLAFEYGRAKGYRAAKAEARKGRAA